MWNLVTLKHRVTNLGLIYLQTFNIIYRYCVDFLFSPLFREMISLFFLLFPFCYTCWFSPFYLFPRFRCFGFAWRYLLFCFVSSVVVTIAASVNSQVIYRLKRKQFTLDSNKYIYHRLYEIYIKHSRTNHFLLWRRLIFLVLLWRRLGFLVRV